jgi:hypothetical protein
MSIPPTLDLPSLLSEYYADVDRLLSVLEYHASVLESSLLQSLGGRAGISQSVATQTLPESVKPALCDHMRTNRQQIKMDSTQKKKQQCTRAIVIATPSERIEREHQFLGHGQNQSSDWVIPSPAPEPIHAIILK